MADTAVETIADIVESLGGTTDAKTIVPALEDLQGQLGADGLRQYVAEYLEDNGIDLVLSVTDGDLGISLQ